VATRSLLTMEGISVALIVILVVVIFAKLLAGTAPGDGSHSLSDAFRLPSGTSLDTVATAAVFGFLSFAGFEAPPRSARRPTARAGTSRGRCSSRRSASASSTCS
jgi:amino acid transporter